MAQGAAEALGRPRAERRRAADRRARAASGWRSSRRRGGTCSAQFAKTSGQELEAELVSVDGRKIPAGKDFDSATGKLKNPELMLLDEPAAASARRAHSQRPVPRHERRRQAVHVEAVSAVHHQHAAAGSQPQARLHRPPHDAGRPEPVRERPHHLHAYRLDQPGAGGDRRRPRAGGRRIWQRVPAGRAAASTSRRSRTPRKRTKAIRPAGHPFELPEALRDELNADEFKLFDLIWKRTIASQMADARGRRITITIEGEGCVFQVSGKTIDFPGYLRAYVEGTDDPEAELADQETVLPSVAVGEALKCIDMTAKEHTTQPPSRYSEAALTKALEERGIGRPSTYASIIDTIQSPQLRVQERQRPGADLGGVLRRATAGGASGRAWSTTSSRPRWKTTSTRSAAASRSTSTILTAFYFGNGTPGLKQQLEHKVDEIDAREHQPHLDRHARRRRAGVRPRRPLLAVRRTRRPHGVAARRNAAGRSDARRGAEAARPGRSRAKSRWASDPETHKPVYLKVGRFGPYVQRGTPDDEEKPQNASLLKGMKPADVTWRRRSSC